MNWTLEQFAEALRLLTTLDRDVLAAAGLSVCLASLSTALSTVAGVPLGVAIGLKEFRGKPIVTALLRATLALPTVFIGLVMYTFLSSQGLLGDWRLLYTRTAIVIGQFVLALPLVAALAQATTQQVDPRVRQTAMTLGAGWWRTAATVLREGRGAYLAAVVIAFGRVFGEIGISMMLGGNIRGYTRTVTTAIALETAKGEVSLGIALGLVLLAVAIIVNVLLAILRKEPARL